MTEPTPEDVLRDAIAANVSARDGRDRALAALDTLIREGRRMERIWRRAEVKLGEARDIVEGQREINVEAYRLVAKYEDALRQAAQVNCTVRDLKGADYWTCASPIEGEGLPRANWCFSCVARAALAESETSVEP